MIIDNHAHVGIREKTDWDSYEDHMRYSQRELYWSRGEIRRVEDNSIVEDGWKTLWDENLWGSWEGRYDVNFRIEGERYVWEKDDVKCYRPLIPNAPQSPSQLVSLMNKAGIDKAVLQWPRNLNRYISQTMHEYPSRFIGLCLIEQSEAYTQESLENLEMYIEDWGLKGLYYDPRYNGWDGYDNFYTEKYEPLWRKVVSLEIPVYGVCCFKDFEIYTKNFSKLLKRFPDITLVIVHGFPPAALLKGENTVKIPKIAVELVKDYNVYLELLVDVPGDTKDKENKPYGYYSTSPEDQVSKLYGYFGPHDEVIRCLYDTFGPSKLIWGSEFTHGLGPPYTAIQYARQLGYLEKRCEFMSKDDLKLILGGNVEKIYGI